MGASTAYHLTLQGHAVTVIEKEEIACAASGKAGGFLGRRFGGGIQSLIFKDVHSKVIVLVSNCLFDFDFLIFFSTLFSFQLGRWITNRRITSPEVGGVASVVQEKSSDFLS